MEVAVSLPERLQVMLMLKDDLKPRPSTEVLKAIVDDIENGYAPLLRDPRPQLGEDGRRRRRSELDRCGGFVFGIPDGNQTIAPDA